MRELRRGRVRRRSCDLRGRAPPPERLGIPLLLECAQRELRRLARPGGGENGPPSAAKRGGGAPSAFEVHVTPGSATPTAGATLRRMQRLSPRSSQLTHVARSAHAAQQSGAASTLTSLSSTRRELGARPPPVIVIPSPPVLKILSPEMEQFDTPLSITPARNCE